MTPDTNRPGATGPEPRTYPLPRPAGGDPRFTYGLLGDVVAVLETHGYPKPTGEDWIELHMALFRFLYSAKETGR